MKKFCLAVLAVLVVMLLGGCSKPAVDKEKSPVLENAVLESMNQGAENKQYVKASLEFDKEVKLAKKKAESLRITIAGERVKDSEYTMELSEDSKEVIFTIQVTAVSSGKLVIETEKKSDAVYEITDDTGEYAAEAFTLEALIPSGVTLSTAETEGEAGSTKVKTVDTAWNIRSITWIKLLENGECVETSIPESSDVLDGAIAVHGHDFLKDGTGAAAQNIADTLSEYYGDSYSFNCDENRITVEKISGDLEVSLDLEVYSYVKVNGQTVEVHEDETGVKFRQTEVNRELTDSEKKFSESMHISYMGSEPYGTGKMAYSVLRMTGEALGEEQNYSVKDIETLVKSSFENQEMNKIALPIEGSYTYGENSEKAEFQGINFLEFLELCGVDMDSETLYMSCGSSGSGQDAVILNLHEIIVSQDAENMPILAFGKDYKPLGGAAEEEIQGPLCLIIPNEDSVQVIDGIESILIGYDGNPEDPHYAMHNRQPFADSENIEFTVNIYQKEIEYLGPSVSKTFTTKELEEIALANPQHVVRNYYGLIGNEESNVSMGVGGWLDYFEGIDLFWLINERVHELGSSGSAKFYGRDMLQYSQIDTLDYLKLSAESDAYTITTSEGVSIPGAVPLIAYGKNGYPLLKEHMHEGSSYIAYNKLNQKLESLGVITEVGVVKNHNGPFITCMGNREGMYGGYQVETGGDCVQINIYLDK